MQFFLLFLCVSLIAFLFCLYVIGREDLILIRKNVTLEQLFNIAFLALFVGVLSARIFYVLFHPSSKFLNILVFLLIPYFPGLSFIGGIIGSALFILLYTRWKKMPSGRTLDFLSLALLGAVPFGYFGTLFLSTHINYFESLYLPLIYIILFILCMRIVFQRLFRGEIKNGSLGTLLLMTFSFITFIIGMTKTDNKIFYFLGLEDIISLITVLISIFFFLKEEMFVTKVKK